MAVTDRAQANGAAPGAHRLREPDLAARTSAMASAASPVLPSRRSDRNRALDGARVLAALAVLVIHVGGSTGVEFTGSPVSWVVSRGDVGVPIFFVLSGLLLYRPWARAALSGRSGPAIGAYLWRRALRILPAYWVVVIVAMFTLNHPHIRSVSAWAQYLLLVQNYNLHPWWYGTGANGLAQMWSLVVEVSFYLCLPLIGAGLAWWAGRAGPNVQARGRRLLAGIAILGLSSYADSVLLFYPSLRLWLGETLPHLLTWFAGGMTLATLAELAAAEKVTDGPAARLCRTVAASAGACWLIAVAAFAIACTPLAGAETLTIPTLWADEIKTALYTVVATALVAPVAFQPGRPTLVTRLLGNRVMSFLGQISYGVFLWQFLVIYAFFAFFHARNAFQGQLYSWPAFLGILAVVIAATVAIAAVSYYLVERPAQRLYRARRARGQHSRRSRARLLGGRR
jgi:peptidoglycan/LPS O-acetylase OafA/YrhL